MSGNLFEIRKDWPIPPTNDTVTATIPKTPIKIEPQVPSTKVSRPEWCGWDKTAPFAKMWLMKIGMMTTSRTNPNRKVKHSDKRHTTNELGPE